MTCPDDTTGDVMSTSDVITWIFAGIACVAAAGSIYYATRATRAVRRIKAAQLDRSRVAEALDAALPSSITYEELDAATTAVAGPAPTEKPCSCGGRRWVDDENWEPEHEGERARGRVPEAGLIPCGYCNHGGWLDPAPTEAAGRG